MSSKDVKKGMDRRSFLHSAAAVGAGLVFAPNVLSQTGDNKKSDDINVALIGAGEQGRELIKCCIKIPGIRIKAVCDIWDTNLKWQSRRLSMAYKQVNNMYEDYREMLDKENDLDAVIIATPDFWHSEQAIACMKAGLHVYCEKEMSNTLDGAKKMVQAAKETGKLLQIGHQRRSNPVYRYCYDKIIKEANLLNHITTVNGQWNRSRSACIDREFTPGTEIDAAKLEKYGYTSKEQFRNWRWYKGLGGGPIVDLGSHQIDIYSWFLGANPKSVMASGGVDYWKNHEWYDSVMAVYEYETKQGTVRAFYQTITTNSCNGYFESFMGDEGTLVVSEAPNRNSIYREDWVPEKKWQQWEKEGYIKQTQGLQQPANAPAVADSRSSPVPAKYDLPVTLEKFAHQPHLENFFDAIRGKATLNCPAEIGYETAVTVLKVNEAVAAAKKLDFKPEEFKV